ncbi:MAG TPA: NUDIX domain-containing protein [Bacteroidales bacterium]|nr:NUDIX domain-containing protein [Bacteroidales bacterium]
MGKVNNIYSIHAKHYVAVDCIIFGYEDEVLKVLLYPRGFEPAAGKWSLLGGFVETEETLGDAARRILLNTTGLQHIYQEQVHAFSKLDRDPAGRVISVAYYALIRINQQDRDLLKEHGARWWPVAKLPKLIFDHKDMVEDSLVALQKKAGNELIGPELLGDKFTLTQLKKLYEAIFLRPLDAGNFRKKVLSLGVLQSTGIKDKADSKKGAFLYQYVPGNTGEPNLAPIIKTNGQFKS